MSKIDDLLQKAQSQPLSDDEQKEVFQILQIEMEEFKHREPKEYLDLLKEINAAMNTNRNS